MLQMKKGSWFLKRVNELSYHDYYPIHEYSAKDIEITNSSGTLRGKRFAE